MLGPDDAALVERDTAIPGLALLLDPDRLLERLGGLDGAVHAIATTYLRYKPGVSLTAGLHLVTDNGPQFGYAVAYGDDGTAKLANATSYRRRLVHRQDWTAQGVFSVVPECGVVLGSAGFDRELPGIAHLTGAASELLRPLRYKPARRWVAARGPADAPRSIVKVHPPGTVARLAGVHRALHAAGAPVSKLLGVNNRRGILRSRWLTGQALEPGLHGPEAARSAGEALARLHRAPPNCLHGTGLDESPTEFLRAWLELALGGIESIAPGLSIQARDIADRALAAIPGDRPTCVIHGDFSGDQVILLPGGAVIVDLDRARLGDPVLDLANYAAAELAVRTVPNGRCRWTCHDVGSGLLEGYRGGGGRPVPKVLRALTSAAVLAMATEPFRLREPGWLTRMRALLDAAESLWP